MTHSNTTFAELKTGTVLTYNDMANIDEEYVVLNKYEDQFGTWVDMLHKKTNTIAPHSAKNELGNRWEVIANK